MKIREFYGEKEGTNEGLRRGKKKDLSAVFHLESAEFK